MKNRKYAHIAIGAALASVIGVAAFAQATLTFRNMVTGEVLDLNEALPEGRDTPGVKTFLQTGVVPYIEDQSCLKQGEQLFLSACSGCHGHVGEGKIGPGLNDDYWTYPENKTDAGLFSTLFGGAQAQMGPQYQNLTLDEMLLVIAWIRHLYKDDVKKADWLTDAQKAKFKPYSGHETFPDDPPGQCRKTGK